MVKEMYTMKVMLMDPDFRLYETRSIFVSCDSLEHGKKIAIEYYKGKCSDRTLVSVESYERIQNAKIFNGKHSIQEIR